MFYRSAETLTWYMKCIPDGKLVLQSEWDRGLVILSRLYKYDISNTKPFKPEPNDYSIYVRAAKVADILSVYGMAFIKEYKIMPESELQELIDICETWYDRSLKARG